VEIVIKPKTVTKYFLLIILFLFLAHIAGLISRFGFNHPSVFGLVDKFKLDWEQNVPTFYSSSILLLCSFLLSMIAFVKRKKGEQNLDWFGLAAIFLFLAIDEAAGFHELLTDYVRITLHTSSFLFFAWVIPYGVALVIFLLIYLRFLFRLPRKTCVLFIVSGILYVGGALGFELLGGQCKEMYGDVALYYVFSTIEELLEMIGMVLFIYTLMDYINLYINDLRLRISS